MSYGLSAIFGQNHLHAAVSVSQCSGHLCTLKMPKEKQLYNLARPDLGGSGGGEPEVIQHFLIACWLSLSGSSRRRRGRGEGAV